MTGKPSQLGKALVDDLCHLCTVKLAGCCANIVWAMFREALPVVVRNHIAEMEFNSTTYLRVFEKADQVYDSNQAGDPLKQVAAISADPEVAAIAAKNKSGKNKNQQNKNGQNGGQNQSQKNKNQGQNQGQRKGPKHASAKGDHLCRIHHKFGVNASFCADPWKCEMKEQLKAPQNQ